MSRLWLLLKCLAFVMACYCLEGEKHSDLIEKNMESQENNHLLDAQTPSSNMRSKMKNFETIDFLTENFDEVDDEIRRDNRGYHLVQLPYQQTGPTFSSGSPPNAYMTHPERYSPQRPFPGGWTQQPYVSHEIVPVFPNVMNLPHSAGLAAGHFERQGERNVHILGQPGHQQYGGIPTLTVMESKVPYYVHLGEEVYHQQVHQSNKTDIRCSCDDVYESAAKFVRPLIDKMQHATSPPDFKKVMPGVINEIIKAMFKVIEQTHSISAPQMQHFLFDTLQFLTDTNSSLVKSSPYFSVITDFFHNVLIKHLYSGFMDHYNGELAGNPSIFPEHSIDVTAEDDRSSDRFYEHLFKIHFGGDDEE